MSKILIAGPCISEFGWELMEWQGFVRAHADKHDHTIVCSTEGLGALYADYSSTFIGHKISGNRDCHRMREITNPAEMQRVMSLLKEFEMVYEKAGCEVTRISPLLPENKAVGQRRPIDIQRFIKFGRRKSDQTYDVVIHARNRPTTFAFEGHNYPLAKWNELIDLLREAGLTKIVAIGTKEQSHIPAGVEDKRGIDLGDVMDIMASARLAIGPSSGPIHLASLCGTPHVVWARNRQQSAVQTRNKERYEDYWNPHKTPVNVILHGDKEVVDPSAIMRSIDVLLDRSRDTLHSPVVKDDSKCVVFVTVGKEYVRTAHMCIDTLRHVYHGPVMILTDKSNTQLENLKIQHGVIVKVCDVSGAKDNHERSRILKTQVMQLCPYDVGLFIDADALVLNDIDELWQSLAADTDIAMTLSQFFPSVGDGRKAHHMKHKAYSDDYNYTVETAGSSFPHYSSSTIVWRRTERVLELSRKWYEEWQRFRGCDMFPLARAIHAIKPNIAQLHRKYNLRYHMTGDTVIYTAKVDDLNMVYKKLFPYAVRNITHTAEVAKQKAPPIATSNRPLKRVVRSLSPKSSKGVVKPRTPTKTLRQLLHERSKYARRGT